MKVSVIMPSYLDAYKGAAKDREQKFLRAVDSVIDQSHEDWELMIVADGCERTMELVDEHYGYRRIRPLLVKRNELWCPGPRNTGIHHSTGDWIAYLDTDDYFGPDHLTSIVNAIEDLDPVVQWAWMDALWWSKANGFQSKRADIKRCSGYGTANIVHRNAGYLWPTQRRNLDGRLDYGTQDCAFVDTLKAASEGVRITAGEYHVCHIPSHIPGAYDL